MRIGYHPSIRSHCILSVRVWDQSGPYATDRRVGTARSSPWHEAQSAASSATDRLGAPLVGLVASPWPILELASSSTPTRPHPCRSVVGIAGEYRDAVNRVFRGSPWSIAPESFDVEKFV